MARGRGSNLALDFASRLCASASRSGGLWSVEHEEEASYVIELPSARRLAVIRDLGPIRTVHLMTGDPPILSGEKGPLDPRLLGPRAADFAERFPDLVTILDVAPRLLAAAGPGYRLRWVGDWGGVETSAFIERTTGRGPFARVVQTRSGVALGDAHVRDARAIQSECARFRAAVTAEPA